MDREIAGHAIFNGVDWTEVPGLGPCVNAEGIGVMTANAAFSQASGIVAALSFCSGKIGVFGASMVSSGGFSSNQAAEFCQKATQTAAARLEVLFGMNSHAGGNA